MALVANNISGSASNNSHIGITGSVIFANQPGSSFPSFPSPSTTFFVSGSRSVVGADDPSIIFKGDTFVSGNFGVSSYLQLKPVDGTIPTDTSASYIYTSGSTNDLYFRQYSGQYTNTTRLRWLDGTLSTGVLFGGVLSTETGTTTFSITSGSGIIVTPNASLSGDPYPTIKTVEWPSYVSQSLSYVTTAQLTYIGINSSGGIIQRDTPFSDGDYLDCISVGRVLHQNKTNTNAAVTAPSTAYSVSQQTSHFARAFGPLKIKGHVLAASGSTLSLVKTGGDAYSEGRNYKYNPNDPNYTTSAGDPDVTVSKIYREYVSGSTYISDTGIGYAGYTTIDPTQYNNNGTLAAVGGQTSIQRAYWFPNSVDRAFHVYYGSATYNSLDAAEAAITTEKFVEGDNTKTSAIYVAAVLVKGNATNLSDPTQARIIQGGLFRNVTSTGGGGVSPTVPGGIDTYVQFNDGGSTFGGDAEFTYNKTTNVLTVGDVSIGDSGVISTSNTVASIFNTNPTTVSLAGNATTLNVGKSTGTNNISGQTKFTQGLSGSLTKLTDGTSYLIADGNISITTGSNGAVTIGATGVAQSTSAYVTIGNDATLSSERALTAGTGIKVTDGGANNIVTLSISDSTVATISGTTFTGITKHNAGLSGSLTKLTDGTSYIIADGNMTVTTGTNGAVTLQAIPAGSTNQIQYNSSNVFAGNASFTYDGSALTLKSGSVSFSGTDGGFSSISSKGTDVFFYVSGSTATTATSGVTLFGGNIVTSGSFTGKNGISITGDVMEMTGSLTVTSNLLISGTSTLGTVINFLSSSNGGTGTLQFNCNNQSFFYVKAPAGNITANFTNVPATVERLVPTTVILSQSSPAYIVSAVQIDGVAQTLYWLNSSQPTGNANKHDVFGFSLIRSGSTPTWTVLGKMETYG